MKKLVVDLDEVICINSIIEKVNEFFGTDYSNENFPSLYIEDVFDDKENVDEFFRIYENENHYIKPYVLPNCKRVLKQLSKYYEIYICTAYVWQGRPNNTKTEICGKLDFLYKEFDFIKQKNIIFCSDKSIINADILIDDRVENLKGNSKVKLLFTSNYNLKVSNNELEKHNITRINSWQEIKNLLMKIK